MLNCVTTSDSEERVYGISCFVSQTLYRKRLFLFGINRCKYYKEDDGYEFIKIYEKKGPEVETITIEIIRKIK
jgi:hypothetical protein